MSKSSSSSSNYEAQEPREQTSRAGFKDLDKLKNADGLVAIISQRLTNNMITFAIFKEFERDGQIQRTSFVPEVLAKSYLDLATMAVERIAEIRKSGKAPAIRVR
jgi:hypothetical protein